MLAQQARQLHLQQQQGLATLPSWRPLPPLPPPHAPCRQPPTLLTAAKEKGMNSVTAARVASSPSSTPSRNLAATLCREACEWGSKGG